MENHDQAALWESWASSWIAADAWTVAVGGAFGAAAIEALDPTPGTRVLDVGCGSGPTTIELARRVAPGGSVLGIDIAPSMIEAARERARGEGVDGAEFRVADAQAHDLGAQLGQPRLPQAHDLGEAAFDAATSRFGVMFFEDPVVAFANVRRSLVEGGRLAFACWQDLFANEWMFVPGAAALDAAGIAPSLPGPGDPGPFSMCDEAVVAEVLTAAGFADVAVSPMATTVEIPEAQLSEAAEASCAVGVSRQVLDATPDPEGQEAIRAAVREALASRVEDGRLRLAAAAHIVTART